MIDETVFGPQPPEPEIPEDMLCGYNLSHATRGIKADVFIICGPAGIIPVCQKCADSYTRMAS